MDDGDLLLGVVGKTRVADRVMRFDLAARDGAELPAWEPGAHIDIEIVPGLVRQYSLCGNRHDRSRYTIAVGLESTSRGGSEFLHAVVDVGDEVRAAVPRNRFPLVPADKYVFLAGGVGISPIVPMIEEARREGAEWELHYGGRRRSAMAFVAELERLDPQRVRIYTECVHGRPPLSRIAADAEPGDAIYACGPPSMLSELEMEHAGVAPDRRARLHVERFSARHSVASGDAEFEVVAALSKTTATVAPGQSVLNALRSAGVSVPSSCEAGICGSCETKVLGGTPDHRDYFLTPDEKKSDETMMVCVSRCASARLTLEL